jgi:hypothetical protein
MSHNISYCNDAIASPKRLQTTKIQIPDEDRIVKKAFCCKLTENPGFWVQEVLLHECVFLKTGLCRVIRIGDGVIDTVSQLLIICGNHTEWVGHWQPGAACGHKENTTAIFLG